MLLTRLLIVAAPMVFTRATATSTTKMMATREVMVCDMLGTGKKGFTKEKTRPVGFGPCCCKVRSGLVLKLVSWWRDPAGTDGLWAEWAFCSLGKTASWLHHAF